MTCPADHCGQPPQRTPPPLMHAGMPRHHIPQAPLVRAPLPLRHGGCAATPLHTVPIAAPAIQARPFRLQVPLKLLSGRPNSGRSATGPISPVHTALSMSRAALAPRPPCAWAPREAPRRRSTPGLTAPPLSDCSASDAWASRRRKKIHSVFLCARRNQHISREPWVCFREKWSVSIFSGFQMIVENHG